jgi:hypothetical protein
MVLSWLSSGLREILVYYIIRKIVCFVFTIIEKNLAEILLVEEIYEQQRNCYFFKRGGARILG